MARLRLPIAVRIMAVLLVGVAGVAGLAWIVLDGQHRSTLLATAASDARARVEQVTRTAQISERLGRLLDRFALNHDAATADDIDALRLALADDVATATPDVRTAAAAFEQALAATIGSRRALGFSENEGLEGRLRAAVHSVESMLKEHRKAAAPAAAASFDRLMVEMLMLRRHEKDFMLRLDAEKYGGRHADTAARFQALLGGAPIAPGERERLAAAMDEYKRGFAAFVAEKHTETQHLEAAREADAALAALLEAAATAARDEARAADAEDVKATAALTASIVRNSWAVGACSLIFGLLLALSVSWPLRLMNRCMHALATDQLDIDVPCTRRRDEIGDMARATEVFKRQALEIRRLDQERIQTVRRLADHIEGQMVEAVDRVGNRSDRMSNVARTMDASVTQVEDVAGSVGEAANETQRTAESVAAAATELKTSSEVIGAQVARASSLTRETLQAANGTREAIDGLAAIAERIGSITAMIRDVAEQTNLLALNATIEAARAGDAGRGFAVVASEVKSLAAQTGSATTDIARQIDEIQDATKRAVTSMVEVSGRFEQMDTVSSAIATAVDQQVATTSEISRSVTVTTDAACGMIERLTSMQASVAEAHRATAELVDSSSAVATEVRDLRHQLVATIRTSSRDVDRRSETRAPLRRQGELTWSGGRANITTIDLSAHGAQLQGGDGVPCGAECTLSIEGLGGAVRGTIVAHEADLTHVRLMPTDDQQAGLAKLVDAALKVAA